MRSFALFLVIMHFFNASAFASDPCTDLKSKAESGIKLTDDELKIYIICLVGKQQSKTASPSVIPGLSFVMPHNDNDNTRSPESNPDSKNDLFKPNEIFRRIKESLIDY